MKTRSASSSSAGSVAETTQGAEPRRQQWWWVEDSIWTERMLTTLVKGVKGGKWFSLIDKVMRPATLTTAWERVRRNKGASGVDEQSVGQFAAKAETYLEELARALKEGHYQPQAVRRVEIPKSGGGSRPLGIATVKDRIVQTAIKMVIEPIFEVQFLPCSYGFRPGRSCKEALREVNRLIEEGYVYVVDADLKGYFDSIPHERLLKRLEASISDGALLELIGRFLRQDILQGMKSWSPTTGTPQGSVISPMLAHLYLHPLDQLMGSLGYPMVRYCDDFVILCRSEEEATTALSEVRHWVEDNGLTLHPDKTHVGDCRLPGAGFEFLGYRFEAGQRTIRKKSLKALKDKVRAKTRRSRGDSLARIVADLNPILRGWFAYFKHARYIIFNSLDGFIRRRLRSILRQHARRPGFGRCREDHQRWPNKFFVNAGLFTLHAAWQEASQSR